MFLLPNRTLSDGWRNQTVLKGDSFDGRESFNEHWGSNNYSVLLCLIKRSKQTDRLATRLNWSFVSGDVVLSLHLQRLPTSFLLNPLRISLERNLTFRTPPWWKRKNSITATNPGFRLGTQIHAGTPRYKHVQYLSCWISLLSERQMISRELRDEDFWLSSHFS